jgi:hypothetical protein
MNTTAKTWGIWNLRTGKFLVAGMTYGEAEVMLRDFYEGLPYLFVEAM